MCLAGGERGTMAQRRSSRLTRVNFITQVHQQDRCGRRGLIYSPSFLRRYIREKMARAVTRTVMYATGTYTEVAIVVDV